MERCEAGEGCGVVEGGDRCAKGLDCTLADRVKLLNDFC